MINNVVLVGRLTKDLELKTTSSGKAVASFILAVNRPFKSNDGQDADFINCVVWNKTAENMATYTKKGSMVGITGRIQTRNYENNGQRVYVTEVVADNVQFLDTKQTANSNENSPAGNYPPKSQNATQSKFETNNATRDPLPQSKVGFEIDDDDLPF